MHSGDVTVHSDSQSALWRHQSARWTAGERQEWRGATTQHNTIHAKHILLTSYWLPHNICYEEFTTKERRKLAHKKQHIANGFFHTRSDTTRDATHVTSLKYGQTSRVVAFTPNLVKNVQIIRLKTHSHQMLCTVWMDLKTNKRCHKGRLDHSTDCAVMHSAFCETSVGPWCENITSSTKPEVHNLLQRNQRANKRGP